MRLVAGTLAARLWLAVTASESAGTPPAASPVLLVSIDGWCWDYDALAPAPSLPALAPPMGAKWARFDRPGPTTGSTGEWTQAPGYWRASQRLPARRIPL